MARARQFAKNSFWLATSTGIVVLIGAVYRPIISRYLGPEVYGQYAFIQAFVAYFAVVASFGAQQVVTREIGVDRGMAQACLSAAYKIVAAANAFAFASCCLIGLALQKEHVVTLGIVIQAMSLAALAFGDVMRGVLIAFQRSFHIAIADLLGNVLKLGLGIWALRNGYGLLGVLWTFVLTSGMTTAVNWVFTKLALRQVKPLPANPGLTRYIAVEALPFLAIAALSRLYAKSDVLLLSLFKGDRITGYYSAGYVFIDLLLFVRASIVAVAYPVVARMYGDASVQDEGMGLAEAYRRLHKHLLMLFLPASVLLMSFGREILLLVFGKEYLGGVAPLRILAWVVPTSISALISGTFLSATYRQRLNAKLASIGVAVNVSWTLAFVIGFGAMGAAVATVGSDIVNSLVHYVYVKRTMGISGLFGACVRPATCALGMLAAAESFPNVFWVYRLLMALAAYVAVAAVVKPYDTQDWRLIRSVIKPP